MRGLVGAQAQVAAHLPQPMALPAPIEAPRDQLFSGTIHLQVDATDVTHRVFNVRESVPVQHRGPMTLLFPQWTPGDHAPNGPIDKLAGLTIMSDGKRLEWVRDPIQVYAFHVEVPAGATTLDVVYQYLGATDGTTGSVLIVSKMLDLEWQDVVLYPAGYFARNLPFDASVKLPAGWKVASALETKATVDGLVNFAPVSLETLIDSPVMAAQFIKQIVLSNDPVPVRLDVAAEDEATLDLAPEAIEGYKNVVTQAYKLFGSHPYDHYDLMVWLADDFGPAYYEHHRTGENVAPPTLFNGPWPDTLLYRNLFAHGFVHAWNGMLRVPAGMWTANYNTPPQNALLWVFEGLTSYWEHVLTARSGLWTKQDALSALGNLAYKNASAPGGQWRALTDVTNEPVMGARKPQSWPGWQRNMFDAYQEGELIWLDIDAMIRQRTAGKKSLDDFARLFFASPDGSFAARTYTFDEMTATLNMVLPFDWGAYLRTRLNEHQATVALDALAHGGYQISFGEVQSPYSVNRERLTGGMDLRSSLGMIVSRKGNVGEIVWDGPAYRAGLLPTGTIVTVNDQPFSGEGIKAAIQAAVKTGVVKLDIKIGSQTQSHNLVWNGGPRYPRIERLPNASPILDDILAPKP